jgi:hypothetical protein
MGLPTIDTLFPNLPTGTPAEVAALVGGPIGKNITDSGWETCCIRLSRALNYSGAPVEGWASMANPYMDKGTNVRALQGEDKKWYIYSTYDLNVYLTNRYGKPKRFKGDADESTVAGVAGIIMFGWRHVDLWDGSKVARLSLFGHESAKANGVLIWPTPSA